MNRGVTFFVIIAIALVICIRYVLIEGLGDTISDDSSLGDARNIQTNSKKELIEAIEYSNKITKELDTLEGRTYEDKESSQVTDALKYISSGDEVVTPSVVVDPLLAIDSLFKPKKEAITVTVASRIPGTWKTKGTSKSIPAVEDIQCPEGSIVLGNRCVYTRFSDNEPVCPPGNDNRGGQCYKSPPKGNAWTAAMLYGISCQDTVGNAKTKVNDSGSSCWYDRGPGTFPTCRMEEDQIGAFCYSKPRPGWQWINGTFEHGKVCPDIPGGYATQSDCNYDRGVGITPTCKPDESQVLWDCYKKPHKDRSFLSPITPLTGLNCPLNTASNMSCDYTRPAGKPLQCSDGADQLGFRCYDKPGEGREWTETVFNPSHGDICPDGTSGVLGNCLYTRTSKPLECRPDQHQRGFECYAKPGPGRDWTTPGGYIHGVVCPPGTNDSGVTCYYTRGDIRMLWKSCEDFEPGLRDDGSSCYKDTYGRGGGEGRGWWQSCPDDKPDRWGLRCYPKCSPGYHAVGCCLCEADGGPIKADVFMRSWCPPGQEENLTNTFCLEIPSGDRSQFGCNKGFLCDIKKDLKWARPENGIDYCPPWMEKGNGGTICFDKPKEGFECSGGLSCTKSRNIRQGTIRPENEGWMGTCPDGLQKELLLCYDKPRVEKYPDSDRDWYSSCTLGTLNCSFNREIHVSTDRIGGISYCEPWRQLEQGLCYNKPERGPPVMSPIEPVKDADGNVIMDGQKMRIKPRTQLKVTKADLDWNDVNSDMKVGDDKYEYQYGCTATKCGFNRDRKYADRIGGLNSCPEDRELIAGLCILRPEKYKEDGNGRDIEYKCVATICTHDRKIRVAQKSEEYEVRGADGNILLDGSGYPHKSNLPYYCPDGGFLVDGLCVDKPKDGFTCDGNVCSKPIPDDIIKKYNTESIAEQFSIQELPVIL